MSEAYRLSQREIARRLGILHSGVEFWGLTRLEANVAGDTAREAEATRCQQALLVQAQPLRRLLAETTKEPA